MKYKCLIFIFFSLSLNVYCQKNHLSKIVIVGNKIHKYSSPKDESYCEISSIDLKTKTRTVNKINFMNFIDTFSCPQWDVSVNSIFLLKLGAFQNNRYNIRCGILEYKLDSSGYIIKQKIDTSELSYADLYDVIIPNPYLIDQFIFQTMLDYESNYVKYLKVRDFFVDNKSAVFTFVIDHETQKSILWKYYGVNTPAATLNLKGNKDLYLKNRKLWKEVFSTESKKNSDVQIMSYPKGNQVYVITQDKVLYLIGDSSIKLGEIKKDLDEITIVVNKDNNTVGYCENAKLKKWYKNVNKPIRIHPIEELVSQ
jgi:hypothetical protein